MASVLSSAAKKMEENNSGKPPCKYGAECYRENVQHQANFWHPKKGKRKSDIQDEDDASSVKKRKIDAASDLTEKVSEEEAGNVSPENGSEDEVDEIQEKDDAEESDDSDESEDIALPATPTNLNAREEIEWKFKMKMPEDFYDLWKFCKSLDKKNPKDALKETLGLQLVGPYDVLAGELKRTSESKRASYCLHWRYYYDPPEFQTVVRGDDDTQHHLGYYRDEPSKLPSFVGANSAKKNCIISPQGENIFAAIKAHMDKLCKTNKDKAEQSRIQSLQKPLTDWAKKSGHSLETKTKDMKARDKKVVTRTFHGAGIVVPVDASGVGYRELPEADANLKRIFKKIVDSENDYERNKHLEPLDEIISFVQFANDECDYGEGYELGIDLFMFGSDAFDRIILNILPLAYMLLGRKEFGTILQAHMKDRRKENLSMI
ncbi:histone PARylation factor 1-like [Asterias rubens]|uniref:histone PARylation factor 1-like n=1 Tax=Asterias rubens TaxID=7604 RepID=UPI0014552415|nr:histone PARylation factor 1-like [Asterias rubens]